jgi:hypothetical protein
MWRVKRFCWRKVKYADGLRSEPPLSQSGVNDPITARKTVNSSINDKAGKIVGLVSSGLIFRRTVGRDSKEIGPKRQSRPAQAANILPTAGLERALRAGGNCE